MPLALLLCLFAILQPPALASADPAYQPPAPGIGPVLLVGATRGTGLEIARLLASRGGQVSALVRPGSDRLTLDELGVTVITGDALLPKQVDAALAGRGFRLLVSTLGCRNCDNPPDFAGNRNLVDAALRHGRPRFVLVSTIGAGDSAEAAPWITRLLLQDAITLKTQAEDYLRGSGLDYLVIRPGALRDGPPTGRGVLSADRQAMGIIARADLAALLVDVLDASWPEDRVLAAYDPGLSWPWDLFR